MANLCDELHALAFELVGLPVLLCIQYPDVILFVESNRELLRHFKNIVF